MEIRLKETGVVVFYNELQNMYPNVSGPLDDLYDVVFEGPQAQPTRYQTAFRDGVEQIADKWYTKYSVTDMDAETIANKDAEQAANMRQARSDMLADCDWTQVADSPVDKAVWATYRQALRDITAQAGFPWTITWPDAP
tara:strand:+ start:2518 stop:2934 length:417 start_codon:yes stop_codon:yes gene_type:complete